MFITTKALALEGGKGSGNFGHAGRKGKLGGSGKGNSFSDFSTNLALEEHKSRLKKMGFSIQEVKTFLSMQEIDPRIKEKRIIVPEYNDDMDGKALITIQAEYDFEGEHFSCTRTFSNDKGNKICHNDSLELPETLQGQKIGSKLYAKQIKMLRSKGFSEIQLIANSSVGKYAWAKKGFDFQNPHHKEYFNDEFTGYCQMQGVTRKDFGGKWPHNWSAEKIASFAIERKGKKIPIGKEYFFELVDSWPGVLKLQK